MYPIRAVTVYCSSSNKLADVFNDAAAELGAAIARNGWKLVYGGNSVGNMGALANGCRAAGGQVIVRMNTIETGAGFKAGTGGNHYIVKLEGTFTGFLQHLVQNVQADVTTDMTTVCALQ